MSAYACLICGYQTDQPDPTSLGEVRGNTQRFLGSLFRLWKCPGCGSIHSLDPVDYADIYRDYPLNERKLDIFAKGTLRNLLRRLTRAGVKKTDRILDFGCGNGVFVQFLKEEGYARVVGYDPYIAEYARLAPDAKFDCVVANDVIEHVPDPRAMISRCASLARAGGILYIGTADAEGVEMGNLEPHVMRLHQPYHRIIVTQEYLQRLGTERGLQLIAAYRRSYMDTWIPFANYRFLDEFNRAHGHNMNRALDPSAGSIVLKKPSLLFYALFGHFFPSAYEPAVVLRNPAIGDGQPIGANSERT